MASSSSTLIGIAGKGRESRIAAAIIQRRCNASVLSSASSSHSHRRHTFCERISYENHGPKSLATRTFYTSNSALKSSSITRSLANSVAAALPESVRDSVKRSILDQVAREDSPVWTQEKPNASAKSSNEGNRTLGNNGIDSVAVNGDSRGAYENNTKAPHTNDSAQKLASRNDSTDIDHAVSDIMAHDSLDDLYLHDRPTEYWPNLPPGVRTDADPFALSQSEISVMSQSIRSDLLGTDHPVLNKAAAYFFGDADGGKKVRPMMVMLLSRALADTMENAPKSKRESNAPADDSTSLLFTEPLSWQRQDLPRAQRRLAEISEMIHTASLFHDDVIDGSDTRRGMPAVHTVFGNKVAILAGDYLLARASICLARLRNVEVVETMSTIIEHLVRGEVMQMRGTDSATSVRDRMVYYLKKNFYKTGSLMANACKSTALLAGCSSDLVEASYKYGKHVGMAFQLADDILDFEGSSSAMGKPALADLHAGLATAPVLFAAVEFPEEMEPLIARKFKNDGDVDRAVDFVRRSDGLAQTEQLARVHAELAMEAILPLAPCAHRDALIQLAHKVVSRSK